MNCEICSKHSKIREIQKIHKTFETQTRVEIGGPKDSKKCSNFANASKKTRSKQADDRKTFCSFLRVYRLKVFLMLILFHVLGIQRSLLNIWPIFFARSSLFGLFMARGRNYEQDLCCEA